MAATIQSTKAKAEFPTPETTLCGWVNIPVPIVLFIMRHATAKVLKRLSCRGNELKTC